MIRDAYLVAATVLTDFLDHPAIEAAWGAPSRLPKMTVGGVAVHLGSAIGRVPPLLAASPPDEAPIPLLEHFVRASWRGGDIDNPRNTEIRTGSEAAAGGGGAALVKQCRGHLAELRERLPAEPSGRVVLFAPGPWALTLDDFLVTRLVEMAVHLDDLAVSVEQETPDLPQEALAAVFAVLTRLAVHEHGPIAVLRALTRAERAPASIAVL
ncbi:maleylpyruvate isomerase N-terminal domain-containing protein [Pilimelia columellifera]|uniref:Mycothiol-dependent maleylpyruvate isomerase metal-binding domain-containing protein n=1 Tax=Pilimelia columellifera subsp. columellifera TaxID=706583 RepID=A0ABN3NS29_9ACTN